MAISHVRDEKGKPFPQIQEFLLGLLKYNDNSTNPVSLASMKGVLKPAADEISEASTVFRRFVYCKRYGGPRKFIPVSGRAEGILIFGVANK